MTKIFDFINRKFRLRTVGLLLIFVIIFAYVLAYLFREYLSETETEFVLSLASNFSFFLVLLFGWVKWNKEGELSRRRLKGITFIFLSLFILVYGLILFESLVNFLALK